MTKRWSILLGLGLILLAGIGIVAAVGGLSGEAESATVQAGLAHQVTVQIIHPYDPSAEGPEYESSQRSEDENAIKQVFMWKGSQPGKVEVVFSPLGLDRPQVGQAAGRLQVDGDSYGMLNVGDLVTVNMMRKRMVMVNGQERRPAPD